MPADKSIAHRAFILSAIADGKSQISATHLGNDVQATINAMRALGITISTPADANFIVEGKGLRGLQAPRSAINCQRSGTSMRLLAGLLSGQQFSSRLEGDAQLIKRPMDRVIAPLREMGAHIHGQHEDRFAPLFIDGKSLSPAKLSLKIASAQVKSALLLAGLYADGTSTIEELGPSRNHTEIMLQEMGASLRIAGKTLQLEGAEKLHPLCFDVPGDISSAAFFIALGVLHPHAQICIKSVGVNKTRTGFIDALQQMGAAITLREQKIINGEAVADIYISTSELKAAEFSGEQIVRMIDELPILAVVATQASGVTIVRNAEELKVKESNRIAAIVTELRKLGAHIEELPDGFIIVGKKNLVGTQAHSHGDHRIAMALIIAGCIASGSTQIQECDSIADSFPIFFSCLESVGVTHQT